MNRPLACLAACVAFAAPIVAAQQAPAIKTDEKSIVKAATAYVEQYKKDFAFLVADELYWQTASGSSSALWETRSIRGEMFLTYLAGDRTWSGVRDVLEVDGEPVVSDVRARDVLISAGNASALRRVTEMNSRYNVGSVTRNTNEPMFALQILDPRYVGNFEFDRKALDKTSGTLPVATLEFSEKARPTLVRTFGGVHLFAKGELVVEAGTGRVLRTSLRFDHKPVRATQTTTYANDERLSLMVPTMYEEYYILRRSDGTEEHTTCRATYTNYRRFEVTGRIKK